MAYSRWLNSVWYVFHHVEKSPDGEEQLACWHVKGGNIPTIPESDLQAALESDVWDFWDLSPPKKDIEELKTYVHEWLLDLADDRSNKANANPDH